MVDHAARIVLLIEDHAGDVRLIREMLADAPAAAPFAVVWAPELATGLGHLDRTRVDAVLLDMFLPDSHGLDTFRAVHARAPHLPIVILTGLADEGVALTAVREGSQDYLRKGEVDGPLLTRALTYAIERQRTEEALRFLGEASALLVSSLDYGSALAAVARLAVATFADSCVVDLVSADGALNDLAVAATAPLTEQIVRSLRRRQPPRRGDPDHPVARALDTGQPVLVPDIPDEEVRAAVADPALDLPATDQVLPAYPRSVLSVPMVARDRSLGAITFGSIRPRQFGQTEADVAAQVARVAAQAIENALLLRETQDAVRLRDTVLSAVAHDLRNPLTAIRLISDTLRLEVAQLAHPGAADIATGLERIDANARRIAAQTEELLDLARLHVGQALRLRRRPTDLVALVRAQVADHQGRTGRHAFHFEAAAPQLVGRWDAERLERVVGNLLGNAIKYSPAGSEVAVWVGAEEAGGTAWACLVVRDRGIGIPAADLPRVFTWFHRGRNVPSEVAGSGIGLAGARAIVEAHGGSIAVASEENVGSTFTVRLPLEPPPPADTSPPEPRSGPNPS